MSKARKIIIIITVALFIAIAATGAYFLFIRQAKSSINTTFNSTVNFDFVYNSNNECYRPENEKDTVVFVLSNSCASCVKQLEIIKYIGYIVDSANVMILWENEIPWSRIESLGVSDNIENYTLKGKAIVNTGLTPQSFVMDCKGKVIFSNEDSNIGKTINVIFNDYKNSNYLEKLVQSFEKDNIVFVFDNDMDTSNESIDKYKEKGYLIVNITSINQGSQNNVIYDEGGLFKKLFEVNDNKALIVCEYGKPVSYINY